MNPGLYIVGTPIGNLQDITLRALDTLKQADIIFAEDTRISQRLLARYDIRVPLQSCHKFNEASRVEQILGRLRAGQAVALVTDSGMPGVSDPGSRMAAACREAGFMVTVIPGPSAVTSAVALCGFASGGFRFIGFLPHKSGARRRRLEEVRSERDPVVLFESPFRFLKLLDEIEAALPGRRIFVGRELTKQFEECRAGAPADLRAAYAGRSIKGEFVVVVEPAGRRAGAEDETAGDEGDGCESGGADGEGLAGAGADSGNA